MMAAGCSMFVAKSDSSDPLEFAPANYDQKEENGAAVFTLSAKGEKAKADQKAGIVQKQKKKWWHIW